MKFYLRSVSVKLITLFILTLSFGVFQAHSQSTGVLIMAHGGGEEWNQHVKDAADPLEENRICLGNG